MRKRNHQANGAVAAHAQHCSGIKIDYSGQAFVVFGLNKQRSNHCWLTAWFKQCGLAKVNVVPGQSLCPIRKRARSEIRPAIQNDACWFAAGMAVDYAHFASVSNPDDHSANHSLNCAYCVSQ